jgi:hypothetical protein
MGKKRNLNGLPNSLEQSYFSTLFYWHKGYMADWIWNAANEKEVTDIEIDILNKKVKPTDLEIEPIIAQLFRLQETIEKTLKSNGFSPDFITEAKFNIYISQKYKAQKLFSCQAIVTDRDGKNYEGKTFTEKAYESSFRVFPISLSKRIKNLIKK